MRKCPKFKNCSVPICPLDLNQDYRDRVKNESKCKLSKKRRMRIAKNTKLERQGMTKSEWAAKKRWDGLAESEKQRRIAKLIGF